MAQIDRTSFGFSLVSIAENELSVKIGYYFHRKRSVMSNTTHHLEALLKTNQTHTDAFKENPLMRLIASPAMQAAHNRVRLLDCIQVFSNYFQKTVMLRAVLNDNNRYVPIVRAHLVEEFGHDVALMHDRKDREPIWDPILEACSCWFSWQMLSLDNSEKTVLVHMVLEASAHLFFIKAHHVMRQYAETDYFKIHADVDEHHETMGLELLTGLRDVDYQRLSEIQQQGWDMLNAACRRMAELTQTQEYD